MATGNKKTTTTGKGGGKPGRPRKNAAPARKNAAPVKEPESFMRSEVMVILSFALAVLLFLSNFHLCGVFGDFLRRVQLGIFGMIGYVFPVLLFAGTCFYMSCRGRRGSVRKMLAVVAAVISLCGFAQLIFSPALKEGETVLAYYRMAAEGGLGGGLVGGLIRQGLVSVLGTVGAFLILMVCFVISAVFITERSVVNAVKKRSDTVYQHAREDMGRRRELRAERQEERRRLREEQRVRGVNLNSTTLTAEPAYEEDYDEDGYETGGTPQPVPADDGMMPAEWLTGGAQQPGGYAGYGAQQITEQAGGYAGYGAPQTAEQAGGYAGYGAQQMAEQAGRYAGYGAPQAARMAAASAVSPAVPAKADADVFTGRISMPPEYEDDDDTVPFDVDTVIDPAESAQRLVEEGISRLGDAESLFPAEEPVPFADDTISVFPTDAESISVSVSEAVDEVVSADNGLGSGTFAIPEEEKRVVTASGKVIETETEVLQKKLEAKRKEAQEAGETSVQQQIEQKEEQPKKEYVFPPVSLLKRGSRIAGSHSEREYKETAIKLQQTLRNFGVGVTVTNISCGPSVTRYELHPEQGVKVSKIVGLADDIKLSLAAEDIRIEAPIPGKSAVGIEVPNKENNTVYLRDLLEADTFKNHASRLAFAVGKDIGGQVVVTDIAKMPHLLIAGATGSGKSVCINTLIMSIIYKSNPDDVKMIMVDPKVVELSVYNGIPHLLIPVVTDPKKASGALNWAVAEMTDRYKKFAEYNVRDLKGYNAKVEAIRDIEDEKKPKKLPQIVIIVDELADLMMVAPGEVEDAICRLAQLARAAGIHLVIATQRPSVNVITGLIKANIPSRIAFSVSSGVDSRTIIDMNGAEKLLGKGDMLFYPAGYPKPQRVQGAFVSDQEVQKVVDFLTDQGMTADYNPEVEKQMNAAPAAAAGGSKNGRDEYFEQAGRFIIEKEKASIGMLQRMFKIGFNRAARIMDQLAEAGVVGEEEGTKPRRVLMTMDEFEEMLRQE